MKRLVSNLNSGGMLVLCTAVASVINMYSFIGVPLLWPSEQLGIFIEHNYLGGTYMALIGSSVGPIGIFLYSLGSSPALGRYLVICVSTLCIILVVGDVYATLPYSYYAVLAAIFLHWQGLLLAFMIGSERVSQASFCVLLHPACFASAISIMSINGSDRSLWIHSWVISAAISLIVFMLLTDWSARSVWSGGTQKVGVGYNDLLSRMFVACAFPVFFQMELILVGNYTLLDLTKFGIIQKLYMSIAIALFANLSALLIARDLRRNIKIRARPDWRSFFMSVFATGVVIVFGLVMILVDYAARFEPHEVLLAGIAAGCFTTCAYVNARQIQTAPFTAGAAMVVSLLGYLVFFSLIKPSSFQSLILLSIFFFGLYLLASLAGSTIVERRVRRTT